MTARMRRSASPAVSAAAAAAVACPLPSSWGMAMLVPYVVVFVAFVLYPIAYGLWLARHPETYVELVNDPIFLRRSSTPSCSWRSPST